LITILNFNTITIPIKDEMFFVGIIFTTSRNLQDGLSWYFYGWIGYMTGCGKGLKDLYSLKKFFDFFISISLARSPERGIL